MPTNRFRTIASTGALAATALLASVAGATSASATSAGTPDLTALKARCDAAIADRQATLASLNDQVADAKHLTAGDRSTLQGQLSSTSAGLRTLRTTIDGDTTLAQARSDCHLIVSDYRVYVLVAPKTHLVIGSDAALAAVSALQDAEAKVGAAIAAAPGRGIAPDKIADAQAKAADLTTQTNNASTAVTPLVGQLVPLTPAQYDAGTAGPVLSQSRSALQSAKTDLTTARAELKAIIADLKA